MDITPEQIEGFFTRNGTYHFARWSRPIVPVCFGVEDETISIVKGAFEAVVSLAGHHMAETDPELGSNCMFFFFREWDELLAVPDLGKLVPDLLPQIDRLTQSGANQYRAFRFEADGAIRAAFVFIRMDASMSDVPADTLALTQVVQCMLLWSDAAFRDQSPLALIGETTVLRPEIGAVIAAAYDPILPAAADDPSHALRVYARAMTKGSNALH